MTTIFLYIFIVGFGLTIVSAVLGVVDLGMDGGADGVTDLATADHANPSAVSPINFQSVVAFMMGFGGLGYLLTKYDTVGPILAVVLASIGGIGTGWLIVKWLRFLTKGERPLPPTEHVGTIGKLTIGIRAGGTGEMVYSHHGTRMVTAARSIEEHGIARGEEVVILRYEKGIAYVQPWAQLQRENESH
jgi:hypothetical protein